MTPAVPIHGPVDGIACANLRGGFRFAVASAYRRWTDVSEEEVRALLDGATGSPAAAAQGAGRPSSW